MPALWNLPTTGANFSVQDVERFNKLPFYVARQQVREIPYWSRWRNMFGKIAWKKNMGDTLLGVVSEYSPKSQQTLKPKFITNTPLKTVASHFERTNVARIYRHKFESPQFHFLPSFRDFRTGQLDFASKDLTRQIAFGYDDFVRWQVLQISPHFYVVGATTPYIQNVPVGPPGEGNLADPKDANFFASIFATIGAKGYLDFRQMCAVRSYARNVIGMVPYDGPPGTPPSDNSILSGKWVLIGEAQLYEALTFDEHVLNTRDLPRDLLNKEFMGIISGNILFRAEKYPIRMLADGTMPAPELEQQYGPNGTITSGTSTVTDPGGAIRIEVVPNDLYTMAPFGIAFWLGDAGYDTIDVGPPPAEFASAKLDTTRISKLTWNGEVRLTDNLLINYGGAGGLDIQSLDTNKYGEFLQMISDVTMGIVPKKSRNVLPIGYRRDNTPSLGAND